ncbi:restriction endonuclease subunit S [Escherichia coli]|uniref:restriction endonuclease subunit S n=1 Tax=Escherichia coli TaxID=562 RepID=UPI000929BBDD|nr:restriction endonuclease subunit S [Escherichia coli]OJO14772.1 restriction endonuclease subunit S [Escherichia coli]
MSEMSYLEKLLDGVEVEWLPLGEVSALRRGRVMSKGYLTENFGPYPVYSSQTANNGKIGSINTFDFDGEYISWTTDGANAGTVFYRTGKFSITNVCGLITLKSKYPLIYKFLFYWLTIEAKKHVYSGMGNPKLMSHQVENIPVPIPCPDNPEKSLAIQSEIVRILDKFTALTAELTAELNMRKKQYNYYRDQLLSFKEGEVNWTTLGNEELFHICAGGTPSKSKAEYWDNGSIPWLKSESCNNKPVYFSKDFISELGLKKSTAKLLPKNTTLIALVGATIFKTAFLEFEATTNQNIASIKSTKENIIADKFIFYFLTNLYNTLKSEMRNYGMLNLTNLRQFRIPIPCIAEQKRIVSILDKFDALTNSITEGLPREIELRQKQYEYYRDLLFSFPKPETVSN